ncbi:hypothetical protein ACOBQX_07690 [Actinokineospora sp. G85]|uniref:hypothetical protein n=1 Tax=Actinokineospora sp. G85 TaxID=3406626 RepID=UPI003C71501D
MTTWVVHAVGNADLGLPARSTSAQVDGRLEALRAAPDPAGLLSGTGWGEPVPGLVSPLAAVVGDLDGFHLVLVSTEHTHRTARALEEALLRAPAALGGVVGRILVAAGSLAEKGAVGAVSKALAGLIDTDTVLITWGSGSTQLAFGMMVAAIDVGARWRLAVVGTALARARVQVFDPAAGLRVDPAQALARRWGETAPEQRARHAAHLAPDLDGLRGLVADALVKADGTSGFAVREYIWARYEHDRDPGHLDLRQWATERLGGRNATTGLLLTTIRTAGPRDPRARAALDSPAGRWLTSRVVDRLNQLGVRSSHRLVPPTLAQTAFLRRELGIPVACAAWHIGVVGLPESDGRVNLFRLIDDRGPDQAVAAYLAYAEPGDVPLRHLVLGTGPTDQHPGTAAHAREIAGAIGGVADIAPDSVEHAHQLLAEHWPPVADVVGAIVLVPTGPKTAVLPLLLAAFRLAAENGLPLYLSQMVDGMGSHQLVTRFGAHLDLLDLAATALSTLELDWAARLLDACAEPALAQRARQLAVALSCRTLDPGLWPAEFAEYGGSTRARGLVGQRLRMWAGLAAGHPEPAHQIRALCGACAVLEQSVRQSNPDPATADKHWQRTRANFARQPRLHLLSRLATLRDRLPITHGHPLTSPEALAEMVGSFTGHTDPAAVLTVAASAADHAFGKYVPALQSPSLPELHAVLSADISRRVAVERDRLVRAATQHITGRTQH